MLGLGNCISNSDVSSKGFTGYFEKSYTLSGTINKFIIQAGNIKHYLDTDFQDDEPGVLISNFVCKINGVAQDNFNFDSTFVFEDDLVLGPAVVISGTEMSFADSSYYGSEVSNRTLSSDPMTVTPFTSSDWSSVGSAGDTISFSGNITLKDGSEYIEYSSAHVGAYIQFLMNSLVSDRLKVYLKPGYVPTSTGSVNVALID